MKAIALWILESVLATAVIVFFLVVPQAFQWPGWAVALSTFPILVYLSWRLDGRATWQSAALVTLFLSTSLFVIETFAPASWQWATWIIVAIVAMWAASRFLPDKKRA
jgi:hypothetical protein